MNLKYVTYLNIWPFYNKLITVDLRKWKYLVKAPIWTWKSFLFFDGPLFALYKYSQRTILNTKSKEWFIKLIFEHDWETYLIVRDIKATKSWWESVQSRFFKFKCEDITLQFPQTLNFGLDLWDLIWDFEKEEIQFKGNNELQGTLEELLPPREVFLSTNFLMQESDNVFEMTPADRINVFKNIFWLIWIDMAKEKISDKRKDLQLLIKLKSDTQNYDAKLKKYLEEINVAKKWLEGFDTSQLNLTKEKVSALFQDYFFQDFELIKDKINITDFWIINIPNNSYEEIKTDVEMLRDEIISLNSSLLHKQAQLQQINNDIINNKSEFIKIESKIQDYKHQISSFDEKQIITLKAAKLDKQTLSENLYKSYDKSIFENKWYKIVDIYDMDKIIDEHISDWKNLKLQLDNLEVQEKALLTDIEKCESKIRDFNLDEWSKYFLQLQDAIEQKKNEINSEIEKIRLKEKNLLYKKDSIKSIHSKIDLLNQTIEWEKTFLCDKIWENCPYINVFKNESINAISSQKVILENELASIYSWWVDKIDEQLEILINQINSFENDLKMIETKYEIYLPNFFKSLEAEKQSVQRELSALTSQLHSHDFNGKKQQLEFKINELKSFLWSLDWKSVKDWVVKVKNLQQEINDLDKKIVNLELQEKNILQLKENIINLNSQLDSLNKQILALNEKSSALDIDISSLKVTLESRTVNNVNWFLLYLEKFIKAVNITNDMIIEFKHSQIEVNKFKEDEKIYWDLFNVFSKELMLVVLEQFLPSLSDAINNYLVQIVDYTLKFDLVKRSNDKLELDIQVHDEKWVRQVKSLSWWQKTVLKLIWILAVSSIMKSKFLFLDETINNLDYDTIWKVADVIQDFVNSSDIKFYVVTHSKQIQDMNIWDWVIDFNQPT